MLQWNSPHCYIVRTVHHHEHFRLWKFCSEMCSTCEGHSWDEESAHVLIISCSFQLLIKDAIKRLGAYDRSDRVREQPFFKGIDWSALRENREKPPQKPKIVKVSSTDSVVFSCHKQLLLTLHVYTQGQILRIFVRRLALIQLPSFHSTLHNSIHSACCEMHLLTLSSRG
jgi:hypothetical protein